MSLLRIFTANKKDWLNPRDTGLYGSRLFNRVSAGYTAVELLVVMGIVALVAGLGLFLSFDTYRSTNFSAGVDGLRVSLERARSRAMNNIDESRHGVKITGGNYVIFMGTDYVSRDASKDEVISGGAEFTFTGPDEIVFEQLSGKSNVAGDIVVFNGTKTTNISINYEGRIN